MSNLSEEIAKAAYEEGIEEGYKKFYEKGYKKGLLIGQILFLFSCVQEGYISLEKAAELSEMSVEEFLQKAEEYESTYGETMRKMAEA